jgi:plasmid stability protein
MAAVHIRDIDDAVLAALKERAASNNRSLQGELLSILTAAVADRPRRLPLKTVRVGGPAVLSRDDLYDDER